MKSKLLVSLLFFICLSISSNVAAKEIKVGYKDLGKWTFVGKGFVAADSNRDQTILAEIPGSKGVMLISPESYSKDIVLSYKVKPLTPESVLVALLSASNKGEKKNISFPDKYDGNMKYLITDIDNYFIAFHNSAHKKTPFIRRYPQELPGKIALISAESNIMTTQWHDVEVGKKAGKIWLKIDNKTIVEATDNKMINDGHIVFRMRGTKNRIAIALIKDVTIKVNE
ncbi:MAG: hypothetical protein GY710_06050 [Desulfobacteraceae bacterium]|nr:hypothetical protein [Desulfobacteraceae bacterium]